MLIRLPFPGIRKRQRGSFLGCQSAIDSGHREKADRASGPKREIDVPPPTHAEVPAVHEVAGALADIEASNCSEAVKLLRSHGVVLPNPRSSDGDIPDSTIRRMMRRAGIVASRHGADSQDGMPRLSAFGQ